MAFAPSIAFDYLQRAHTGGRLGHAYLLSWRRGALLVLARTARGHRRPRGPRPHPGAPRTFIWSSRNRSRAASWSSRCGSWSTRLRLRATTARRPEGRHRARGGPPPSAGVQRVPQDAGGTARRIAAAAGDGAAREPVRDDSVPLHQSRAARGRCGGQRFRWSGGGPRRCSACSPATCGSVRRPAGRPWRRATCSCGNSRSCLAAARARIQAEAETPRSSVRKPNTRRPPTEAG